MPCLLVSPAGSMNGDPKVIGSSSMGPLFLGGVWRRVCCESLADIWLGAISPRTVGGVFWCCMSDCRSCGQIKESSCEEGGFGDVAAAIGGDGGASAD